MNVLVVVNRGNDLPYPVAGASVVSARSYLGEAGYATMDDARVFNLCTIDRYQGRGYYVSLVAEARGHRPWPDVRTIEDALADEVALLVSDAVAGDAWPVDADDARCIDIDGCFGRDLAGRNHLVCDRLFAQLRAPLFRATFERRDDRWRLARVRLLGASQLDPEHRACAAQAAADRVAPARVRAPATGRPALAVLYDDDERDPPSNAEALAKLRQAAEALGMRFEILNRDAIGRLPSFDALFIRDTTHVNHPSWQFARQAAALGLVVIDDPDSILKCSNKVFVNELLSRHRIPMPRTLVVHRGNVDEVVPALGLPCIVKRPDSAFSRGVAKVETHEALQAKLAELFKLSELVVAQEWLPTAFDWRIGVLDGRPLFACKYMMAPGHWQVVKRDRGRTLEGATVALAVGEVPSGIVANALRAANLVGDGLYGVDLKEVAGSAYVIEVNDNPNIDAGNEDRVLGDALYRELAGVFLRRIRERHGRT